MLDLVLSKAKYWWRHIFSLSVKSQSKSQLFEWTLATWYFSFFMELHNEKKSPLCVDSFIYHKNHIVPLRVVHFTQIRSYEGEMQ